MTTTPMCWLEFSRRWIPSRYIYVSQRQFGIQCFRRRWRKRLVRNSCRLLHHSAHSGDSQFAGRSSVWQCRILRERRTVRICYQHRQRFRLFVVQLLPVVLFDSTGKRRSLSGTSSFDPGRRPFITGRTRLFIFFFLFFVMFLAGHSVYSAGRWPTIHPKHSNVFDQGGTQTDDPEQAFGFRPRVARVGSARPHATQRWGISEFSEFSFTFCASNSSW